MYLVFNPDIVSLLLNTNGGETVLQFWSTLIVVGSVLVGVLLAWSRKSCLGPAEIASFVFLILFKDGRRGVSLRFYFFCF